MNNQRRDSMAEDKEALDSISGEAQNKPYGGLLGDSVTLRVVEEIVADPNTVFSPTDLAELTDSSAPAVRKVLNDLLTLKFIKLANRNPKRPVYSVVKSTKRFLALELLAYARLDDREGTTFFDERLKEVIGKIEFSNHQ